MAVPCSSFTWTTIGCGNKLPVCAFCFPPLDSTIAVPNAVGLGSGADPVLREQDMASDIPRTATARATAELRSARRVVKRSREMQVRKISDAFGS